MKRLLGTIAAALAALAIVLGIASPALAQDATAYARSTQASQNGVTFTVQWNDAPAGQATAFHVTAAGGSGSYKARMDVPTYWDGGGQESVCDPSRGAWTTYSDFADGGSADFTFEFTASGTYRMYFYFMDKDSGVYYLRAAVAVTVDDPARPAVSKIVADAVAQCRQETDGSEYAMALWLHDWTLDQLDYDRALNYCSAESGLTRHTGTCESYQRIYEKLLNAAGIANGRIVGNGHTWNAVKIDGEWCQMDLTWDDSPSTYGDLEQRHLYFGLTDELMAIAHSDHVNNYQAEGYAYRSTAPTNNYYVRNGKTAEWAVAYSSRIQQHLDAGEKSFEIDADNPYDPPSISGIKNGLIAWQMNQMDWQTASAKVDLTAESVVIMTSNTTWTAKYEFTAKYDEPTFSKQPEDAKGILGSKVKFSVESPRAASYQWQSTCDEGNTWWDMTEATAQKPTVEVDCTDYRIGRLFRCRITTTEGIFKYSGTARLYERKVFDDQPVSVEGVIGSKVKFSVTAPEAISYQWQSTCDGGKTWWDMTEATAQKPTVEVDCTDYRIGRLFRCRVVLEDGETAFSTTAKLAERIVFVSQPNDISGVIGTKVKFSVTAPEAVSYQWQSTCDGGKTWWDMFEPTAQLSTVEVDCTAYRIGRLFRCRVTLADGTSHISRKAKLTERKVFISQPADVEGTIGSKVDFSVETIGGSSYQWQSTCDGGKSWWNMTEPTAQRPKVEVDCTDYRIGRLFRCQVTLEDGTVVSSREAKLSEKSH